eukprot:Opistho-2@6449
MDAAPATMELRLRSPVKDFPDEVYVWPLNMIDEYDPAHDLLETTRLVSKEFPELDDMFTDDLGSVDRKSHSQMADLCARYNCAIDQIHKVSVGAGLSAPTTAASFELVHHIMKQVYNRVIDDPMRLNNYRGFSEEVYGEFTFEMVNEVVREIALSPEDTFIDLGSGVGQVVLQVAAQVGCARAIGIEKKDIPGDYADSMAVEFTRRMAWWGKSHGAFELHRGDFLHKDMHQTIIGASVLFINNFAFGPELNNSIRQLFGELKEGARIVSSLNFCPLSFRITERTANDVAAIIRVRKVTYTGEGVSWTAKPFDYYVHTIDRSGLEKFFKSRTQPPPSLAIADGASRNDNGDDSGADTSSDEWGASQRRHGNGRQGNAKGTNRSGKSTPRDGKGGHVQKGRAANARKTSFSVLLNYLDGDTSDASSLDSASAAPDRGKRATARSTSTPAALGMASSAVAKGVARSATASPAVGHSAASPRKPGRPPKKHSPIALPTQTAGAVSGGGGGGGAHSEPTTPRGASTQSAAVTAGATVTLHAGLSRDKDGRVSVLPSPVASAIAIPHTVHSVTCSGATNALLDEYLAGLRGRLEVAMETVASPGAGSRVQVAAYEAEKEKQEALEQQIEEVEAEIAALDRRGRKQVAKGLKSMKFSLLTKTWKKLQGLLRIIAKHEKLQNDAVECTAAIASIKAEMSGLQDRIRDAKSRGAKRRSELKQVKRMARVVMEFAGMQDVASPGDLIQCSDNHLMRLTDVFSAAIRRLSLRNAEKAGAQKQTLPQPTQTPPQFL